LCPDFECFVPRIDPSAHQIDRDSAIEDFKNGVSQVLIATSIAARGLDVKQLRLVVNYSSPNHYEDYVHRCGRTGRAGTPGTAVTFIGEEEERFAPELVKALNNSSQPVPPELAALAAGFQKKRAEGKVKYGASSGFGGKSFGFAGEERAGVADAKRQQRADAGFDDDAETDIPDAPADDEHDASGAASAHNDDDIVAVKGFSGSSAKLKQGAASTATSAAQSAAVAAATAGLTGTAAAVAAAVAMVAASQGHAPATAEERAFAAVVDTAREAAAAVMRAKEQQRVAAGQPADLAPDSLQHKLLVVEMKAAAAAAALEAASKAGLSAADGERAVRCVVVLFLAVACAGVFSCRFDFCIGFLTYVIH
jgi:ATP-dependent RNA helicase DDX46/PRP5